MPGEFRQVRPCFSARPERGRTWASKPGIVAASGGTSGRSGTGALDPTAKARSLPSRRNGKEVETVMKALSVSLDNRLRTTSAPLR